MEYIVWTKDQFTSWERIVCDTLLEAQEAILDATKAGKEIELTQVVPFSVDVKVGTPGQTPPSKPRAQKPISREKEDKSGKDAVPAAESPSN